MLRADERRRRDTEEAAERRREAVAGPPQQLLELQRGAGNQAVTRRLQRTRMDIRGSAGGRAVLARDKIRTEEDEIDVGEPVRSREAPVYIVDNAFVYKAYSDRKIADELEAQLRAASDAGVPVPKWWYYPATLVQDGKRDQRVWVIKSRFVTGTTFYAAKGGGPAVFRNAVNELTDVSVLRKMLNGLNAAKDYKLSDPQGIVNATGVYFFDIHSHKGNTGMAVDTLIESVTARMKELGA
jgi:hypothetical protein